MVAALKQLGIAIKAAPTPQTLHITGCGGQHLLPPNSELFVANSGTTARFLTAMLTLGRGTFRLDGTPRMAANARSTT